jgi:hypothetical protein
MSARSDDSGGGVFVVPALGGAERKLTDVVCPFGNAGYRQVFGLSASVQESGYSVSRFSIDDSRAMHVSGSAVPGEVHSQSLVITPHLSLRRTRMAPGLCAGCLQLSEIWSSAGTLYGPPAYNAR